MPKKPTNRALAKLLRDALLDARPPLTIDQLGELSGVPRQTTGRLVRGEIHRPAPDIANAVVPHLPITMTQFLEAVGYNISPSATQRLPPELLAMWPRLAPEVRQGLLALVRAAATPGFQEGNGSL